MFYSQDITTAKILGGLMFSSLPGCSSSCVIVRGREVLKRTVIGDCSLDSEDEDDFR